MIRAATGRGWGWAVLAFLGAALAGAGATDDRAERTVIVVNAQQAESVELGEFYARQRGIPRDNIVALPMPPEESVTWRVFVDQVWQPLQDELHRRKWIEGTLSPRLDALGRRRTALTGHRIAYLVLCRGTPLKIQEDPTLTAPELKSGRLPAEFNKNQGAVDSELSLLAHGVLPVYGSLRNPLFQSKLAVDLGAELVVKVARLDGPSNADVRAMILSGLEAEKNGLLGRAYVDLGGPHPAGDRWLDATRARLVDLGYYCDVNPRGGAFGVADRFDAPAFYFGWYAGTVNGPFLREGFRFPPGAIALHIHSFSAGTLRNPSAQWCAPLIARGVAATFGNVFEPYLELTIRPDLLLTRLAEGATLGDAAYFATPVLGWQGVVLGDPLYRPFAVKLEEQVARLGSLPPTLAGYAVARQAAVLQKLGLNDEARALLARGQWETPSVALALTRARFELALGQRQAAVAQLEFLAQMREIFPADWPLVREAGEFVAAHGSAKEALPIYRTLIGARPPTTAALISVLADARKLADATGDLALSLDFARRAAELSAPPPPTEGRR